MKHRSVFFYIFLVFLLYGSCVREFDPPSEGYANVLVVEAFLSNGDDPFQVRLSRSIPIDTSAFLAEHGAQVSLIINFGESYQLQELTPGLYQYQGNIHAQVGNVYQLHIQTTNGSKYQSSDVTMRATPPIEDIEFDFEEKSTGEKGMQLYLNTTDPNNATWYYRWDWDEAWEFRTPYASDIFWDGREVMQRTENINTCWKFGRSSSIEISTSKNLSIDKINNYPLRFVSVESDRLSIKYSILVNQYALSEESYTFWNEMKKFTESLGTLFDPQPSVILGNIHNVNDEKEIVLGYFDASEVQQKRIFIKSIDVPPTRFPNYYGYCTDSTVTELMIPDMIAANYMLVSETMDMTGNPVFLFSYPGCVDCTLYGTNKRPDFWN